ncbi:hypothetical protein L204_103168 [Cryptococcus depauperatus]
MTSDEEAKNPSPASRAFAAKLAKYAYNPTRKTKPYTLKSSACGKSPLKTAASPLKKRTYAESEKELSGSPSKKAASKAIKKPRGYASPEVYQHLRPVNDLLSDNLDLVFCGIKYVLGKQSSESGHHFAHPTNKFWRALHQSGLTSRLMSPKEDHHIVDEYNYGLTNLVDRPTSEQSELSTLEMRLNTYQLLLKFVKYRPKVVCFVGKKIWDIFGSVVSRAYNEISNKTERDEGCNDNVESFMPAKNQVKKEPHMGNSVKTAEQKPGLSSPVPDKSLGLVSHETPSPLVKNSKKKTTKSSFNFSAPQKFRLPHMLDTNRNVSYTYFFVVPSTSGLERTPFRDQVSNFVALKILVESLTDDHPLEGTFLDIDILGVEQIVEKIRLAAIQKSS